MCVCVFKKKKVQGFVRRYNARVYANRVDTMEKRMNENQYSDKLEDEDLFFFNVKKLGDGSEKVLLHCCLFFFVLLVVYIDDWL